MRKGLFCSDLFSSVLVLSVLSGGGHSLPLPAPSGPSSSSSYTNTEDSFAIRVLLEPFSDTEMEGTSVNQPEARLSANAVTSSGEEAGPANQTPRGVPERPFTLHGYRRIETSSMAMSPRISFSHDLPQTDGVPIEQYIRSSSSSSVDFDFCVFRESFDQESSSADELFFDGKILPIEIKKKLGAPKKSEPPPPPPESLHDDFYHSNARKGSKNESPVQKRMSVLESDEKQNSNPVPESEEKQNSSKSWFKRSSSLNCGSGYARSLCPLPLLSRSNSTGSTPNVKRSMVKDNLSNKPHSLPKSASSSGHQKPPLKKSYTSYGNGVKVNPVLNVPTPTLFGLGSIFSTSKDKNRKK